MFQQMNVENESLTHSSKAQRYWIGMGVSLGMLILLIWMIEPGQILDSMRTARIEYLLTGSLCMIVYMIFRAIRWRYLLDNTVSLGQVFHIQNIGYMLTQLLPFRAGDVARAFLIGQATPASASQGLSTMVVERLLDMLLMVLLLPLMVSQLSALPVWLQNASRFSGMMAGLGIVVLVVLGGVGLAAVNVTFNRLRDAGRLAAAGGESGPTADGV